MRSLRRLLPAFVALLCTSRAFGQYAGDFYFSDPTVAVVQGHSTELTVEAFLGSQVFGAAHFELLFDPAQVRIEAVSTPFDPAFQPEVYCLELANRFGVASLNSQTLQSPIGSVRLARIVVTPLVPAGSVVTLALMPKRLLNQGEAALSPLHGFSAQIVVVSAGSSAPPDPEEASAITMDGALVPGYGSPWGDVPFRRAGHEVLDCDGVWSGRAFEARWSRMRTRDSFAQSDG